MQLRGLLALHEDLVRERSAPEKKHDAEFKVVFDAVRQLMAPPRPQRRSIGFRVGEARPAYRRPRRVRRGAVTR